VPVRIEAARLTSAALRDAQCLLSVADETERRYLEQERRSLEARGTEMHRIESLGALASALAHDFNNTLAVVLSHTDLVLLDHDVAPRTRDALVEVRRAATRAADLSKQMLAYARRGSVRADAVDVSALIRTMSALLESSTSKDVEIEYDLEPDLPAVRGEGELIRQIVWNLVVNASEAITPGAGKILIRTRSCLRPDGSSGSSLISCAVL